MNYNLTFDDKKDEFDKVYWERIDSALKKLTFQGEKDVLEEAIKLVKSA